MDMSEHGRDQEIVKTHKQRERDFSTLPCIF